MSVASSIRFNLVQFGGHARGARVASAANVFKARTELGMGRIDTKTHHMHGLIVAPGDRYLDTVDKVQMQVRRRRTSFGKPAKLIMVGQGQQLDAVVVGTSNHVGRGQQAIGDRGMAMQVGVQGLHVERNSSISRAISAG